MIDVEVTDPSGARRRVELDDECVIGKGAACALRLDGWWVGKEHARLFRTPGGVLLDDLSTYQGVYVNGRRITSQYGPLGPDDSIKIGQHTLRVAEAKAAAPAVQAAAPHSRSNTAASRNRHAAEAVQNSRLMAERVQRQYQGQAAATAGDAEPQPGLALVVTPDPSSKQLEFDWRQRIHARLLQTMDLRRQDVSRMSDDHLREEVSALIRQLMQELESEIPVQLDQALLARQVLDETVGLGPLEELLADASVSEIMVNSYDQIYIERDGRLMRHPLTFTSDRAVIGVIERIVAPLGRRIDESSPMVDARLKDGSRVNAIIAPLALKGAALTIRKFPLRRMNADDLVRLGTVSAAMTEFLRVCVKQRKNIVVSGGTGSGKTTLLNILSNFIPSGERIITVEDAAELKLHHEHLVGLESRPANVEGKGAVLIRDLVRNTLRMRPDRIVIGECRGGEALDMLQAMNTGHEGSLTTLHANRPRDALARLETLVLMAGMELPLSAIREQIASAIQIVVQQTRFPCGTRIITSITEVTGMESGKFQLQELFKFVTLGFTKADGATRARVRGYFTGCNMVPTFYDELQASGADLDIDIFSADDAEGRAHGC